MLQGALAIKEVEEPVLDDCSAHAGAILIPLKRF